MLNVAIIEKNKINNKHILNFLNSSNKNIGNIFITHDIRNMYTVLSKVKIDFCIIDLKIFNCLRVKEYLYIKRKVKNIIIINNVTNKLSIYINSVYNYSKFNEYIKEITKLINFNERKENELKKIISQELTSIEYNIKHIGTQYLIETIYIAKITNNYDIDKIEKTIYEEVAKKYNTTAHNVKCNIINATTNMYYSCEEEKLKEYLKIYDIYKPGPKKIISTVLNRI